MNQKRRKSIDVGQLINQFNNLQEDENNNIIYEPNFDSQNELNDLNDNNNNVNNFEEEFNVNSVQNSGKKHRKLNNDNNNNVSSNGQLMLMPNIEK